MWNPFSSSKKDSNKRSQERTVIRLKRVTGELKVLKSKHDPALADEKFPVRVILNDISPNGVGLFSTHPAEPEQLADLELNDPRAITIPCRVRWSQLNLGANHVLSEQTFLYRIGVEFLLENDETRKAVLDFCEACRELAG